MIDLLRQMAIFSKTIDHGSFRGAARELNLSPSVVSHHISQLEDHLGVALLYRTTRKLSLTKDGERLLDATRKMLDAVEGEIAGLSAAATEPSGALRLTIPSLLSQSDLMQKLAQFSQTHPKVDLTLDFSDTRRALIGDGFDLAIRIGKRPRKSPTSRALFGIDRKLVASAAYLDRHGAVRGPDDLAELDWVVLPQVHATPMVFRNAAGQTVTVRPRSRLSSNDAQSLCRLAYEGAGLVVVPDFLAAPYLASGAMRSVLPDWSLPKIDVFAEWPVNVPKHGLVYRALDALA